MKSRILTQTHLKMIGVGREEAFSATLYFESGKTNTHTHKCTLQTPSSKMFLSREIWDSLQHIGFSGFSLFRRQGSIHTSVFVQPMSSGYVTKNHHRFLAVCHETTSLDESCMPRFHKICTGFRLRCASLSDRQ